MTDATDATVAAAEAERLAAEAVAAQKRAEAALAAAEAAEALAKATAAQAAATAAAAAAGASAPAPAAAESAAAPTAAAEGAASEASAPAAPPAAPSAAPAPPSAAPLLGAAAVEGIRSGYAFEGAALELGALMNPGPLPEVPVRIPLAMTNRHGLVAGATGTGKTRTLQGLAEQFSAHGVAVFAADVKGDLSGMLVAGTGDEKLLARTRAIGQDWSGAAFPVEFFSLGGIGRGVPIRATVAGFGPLLLAKVLGLNETQESSLGLVFHYAEQAGLALLDLEDLRAVLAYLVSDAGKGELDGVGGLSKATVGVILRELVAFAADGADVFFGEPEIDTAVFLRSAADGRGIVSLLEVPGVASRPVLYSTFLMWLLADLFNDLPEVGDADRPKLVFFFDEAHLLFANASKDFLAQIVQTVRLIRSKGVGVFFVTQTPKDVPGDVLAQLGSRVQHQLRAFTPDDAKALRATVSTYPTSEYELADVLTSLGTGEAVVTVMNERGAPTPVAWTRLRAPQGSMSPATDAEIDATVAASPLLASYGTPLDRESAAELLTAKLAAAAAAQQAVEAAAAQERAGAEAAAALAKQQREIERARKAADAEYARQQREIERAAAADARRERSSSRRSSGRSSSRSSSSPLEEILGSSATRSVLTAVVDGIFGTRRRR